jgi:hypothetical protein
MSPMPPSQNSNEDDDESNGSEERQEGEAEEEEEEGRVEGTLNHRSRKRDPFHPSPTIRVPHKSLWFIVISYREKGATKQVKKLRKIHPRSQQRGASDYRFHTHYQQNLYETVIMDRKRIVLEV